MRTFPLPVNLFLPVISLGIVAATLFGSSLVSAQENPEEPLHSIQVCKEDENAARLADWTMKLTATASTLVETVTVLPQNPANTSTGIVVSSGDLPAGSYTLRASGTYRYGSETMIADAGFSKRDTAPAGFQCGATPENPWVNMNNPPAPCNANGLNVRVSKTEDMAELFTNWGTTFREDHTYEQQITLDAPGKLYFTIFDNVYSDNQGSIEVQILAAPVTMTQVTTASDDPALKGCTVFENLTTGQYTLIEEMQTGWERVLDAPNDSVPETGIIDVNVEQPTQYVFVNRNTNPVEEPTATPSPTITVEPTATATPTLTGTITPSPTDPTATPSATPAPVLGEVCTEETVWLSEYVTGTQGPIRIGGPIRPERSNPTTALGAFNGTFYSLGWGGNGTFAFPEPVKDIPGADITFYENTINRPMYPEESAIVEISADGITWIQLSSPARGQLNVLGTTSLDIAETGLTEFTYIRLTDIPNMSNMEPTADGFDIDAISGVKTVCTGEPTITPSITVTPDPDPTATAQAQLQHSTFIDQEAPVETVQRGSVYTSTTIITNIGADPVTNVTAITAPVEGADYVDNSWTGTETEPVFSSPGRWNVGTIQPGQSVTISYQARINREVDQGVYKDLVWVRGEDTQTQPVQSQAVDSRYVNSVFAGDEVAITSNRVLAANTSVSITETREETRTETRDQNGNLVGDVLGASTLPNTGTPTIFVLIASAFGTISLLLIAAGIYVTRYPQSQGMLLKAGSQVIRRFKNISLFLVLAGAALLVTGSVSAQELDIRLNEQASPTAAKSIRLSFVALDVNANPITVTCYMQAPGSAGYSVVGSPVSLKAGGNTGFCPVSEAVFNKDGLYTFYAVAQSATGTASSPVITVERDAKAPGTPVSYEKTKEGCSYRIRFKTASDNGLTTRVEVYRSTNTSFNADAGTRVETIQVGSNQERTVINTPADCSKDHYYVIRAFTESGSGSGLIGDKVVSVTTRTTINTVTVDGQNQTTGGQTGATAPDNAGNTQTGAIAVDNANIPPEQDEAENNNAGEAEESNEETDGEVQGTQTEATEEGDVQGAMEEQNNSRLLLQLGTVVASVLILGGIFIVLRKLRKI